MQTRTQSTSTDEGIFRPFLDSGGGRNAAEAMSISGSCNRYAPKAQDRAARCHSSSIQLAGDAQRCRSSSPADDVAPVKGAWPASVSMIALNRKPRFLTSRHVGNNLSRPILPKVARSSSVHEPDPSGTRCAPNRPNSFLARFYFGDERKVRLRGTPLCGA